MHIRDQFKMSETTIKHCYNNENFTVQLSSAGNELLIVSGNNSASAAKLSIKSLRVISFCLVSFVDLFSSCI